MQGEVEEVEIDQLEAGSLGKYGTTASYPT